MDLGRPGGARLYPDLPPQESALGDSFRILRKRLWWIVGCLLTIFSVVLIASLKLPKVYEANGTIEINKPDANLNFQNSATFSLDYFDPTELETDMKILQSDLLAHAGHPGTAPRPEPEIPRSDPAFALHRSGSRPASMPIPPWPRRQIGSFKGNLRVALVPNTRIIEVHYRSPDPQRAAIIVNTLMQTYVENNFKSRFESTMTASDWLKGQLSDLQIKVETSQEKLVRYQKEHEIVGTDEKQNITMSKLDELNKELTAAESERMDKEALYRVVQSGDPDAIASSADSLEDAAPGSQSASQLLEILRVKQADTQDPGRRSQYAVRPGVSQTDAD